jgi:D-sedoheptulose 7-phosphate isomerase
MTATYGDYLQTFVGVLQKAEVSTPDGPSLSMDQGFEAALSALRLIPESANKVMFVGNGGSAGIAGHMAIDFAKNGGIRSMTFNDASSLTCLANDLGYENVFAAQVEMLAVAGDLLIAISSSGESNNILRAVTAAKARGCRVITLSGFKPGNTLRKSGDLNFYVGSFVYGFVETAHQIILHAILDKGMGWTANAAHVQPSHRVA